MGIQNIKQNIYKFGPATAVFGVYADFFSYKSGVYVQKSNDGYGGHAVKLMGWGKATVGESRVGGTTAGERGEGKDKGDDSDLVDYWLVANSWNDTWGDKGTFKIKMGECGIDSMVSAGEVEKLVEASDVKGWKQVEEEAAQEEIFV